MSSFEEQKREIERNELWLRRIAKEPEGLDVDLVKRHVEVAIQERWLLQQAEEPRLPRQLVARVRQRVRSELSEAGEMAGGNGAELRRRHPLLRHGGWIGGLLAAAAVVAFALLVPVNRLQNVTIVAGNANAQDNDPDLFYLDAFEDFTDTSDDFADQLAMLDEDLYELETAGVWEESDVWQDETFEQLRDEIEDLAATVSFDVG
jgi:hypothetical protein